MSAIPQKSHLPPPYDRDLSAVLRNLARASEDSRRELANSPVTAAWLYAGMKLIRRNLGPSPDRRPARVDVELSLERRGARLPVPARGRRGGAPQRRAVRHPRGHRDP